jgi:hypothetical protein
VNEVGMLVQSNGTPKPREDRSASSDIKTMPSPTPISSAYQEKSVTKPVNNSSSNLHDNNYQIKRQADNMLRSGRAQDLHQMIMQQVTRCESLMQDNALL